MQFDLISWLFYACKPDLHHASSSRPMSCVILNCIAVNHLFKKAKLKNCYHVSK